ncbi:MAG TPA: hypothetical protein VFW83_10390 [Bryobacteraceae bacterium]|nr:hypothetical protein [Bryobacteraceae bacterium]
MLYAACQWGMLSVLAKLGDASIVGEFTLGLAVGAPVFMFTNLQLRTVQATDVRVESGFADYFTLRLLATLFGLVVVASILTFLHDSATVRMVVFLVAIAKCVECMSDATAGLLQREERLKLVAISLMIRGVGSVLAFSLAFAYFRRLAVAVVAMIAVWFAVLILYDLPNAKQLMGPDEGFFRFDPAMLKRLAFLSLPLGWVATLQSLNVNIPRYFLEHYMGLADQGIYASLAYLIVVINLVTFALSQSATTRLARMFAEGRRRHFAGLLAKLSGLGILVAAIGAPLAYLVGKPILTLVYRPEYADHVGLLALLVVAAGVNTIAAFLFCGVTSARAFRTQVPVYFGAAIVVTLGSAILIPRWRLMGAATAVLLSAATVALGGLWVVRGILAPEARA